MLRIFLFLLLWNLLLLQCSFTSMAASKMVEYKKEF